jgi:hypothetical protein
MCSCNYYLALFLEWAVTFCHIRQGHTFHLDKLCKSIARDMFLCVHLKMELSYMNKTSVCRFVVCISVILLTMYHLSDLDKILYEILTRNIRRCIQKFPD